MSAWLVAVSLAISGVTCLLCIHQILKRPSGVTKTDTLELKNPDEPIFRAYLFRISLLALLVFVVGLTLAYYLELHRHRNAAPDVIWLYTSAFAGFLLLANLTERLLSKMQKRSSELQRENISRIFRFFLYAGAMLGLSGVLFAAGYSWYAQRLGWASSEMWLFPAFSAAVLLFWLRFHGALLARTADYAYELMRRQEAILPLTGLHNPLWRLRQLLAIVNRFFFYHLEYLVLSLVVLTVGYRIEVQTSLAAHGVPGLLLSVFSLGALASMAAFLIMRVRDKTSPETFLWNIRIGYIAALSVQSIACYLVYVVGLGWHIKYFWIILLGGLTAFLLNLYSAIFVAENHRTARSLISAAASSVSTVVHRGIAAGMRGAAIPALILAAMMSLVYLLGIVDEPGEARFVHGLFALALALTAMVSLFPVAQASALVMPLSSSAIAHLRLRGRKEENVQLLTKFRQLRSVAMPSYVLHAKIFYAALVILIFLIYTQLIGDGGNATLFKHLTETAAMLIGGIASYFLAARINELVLNLGPALVRESSRQFREISGLSSAEAEPDMQSLWRTANHYLSRKIGPLFLGALALPALACLIGGNYGLTGYLLGFGFFGFLSSNSWLTTGAAWSSARHAAEADAEVSRHSAQLEALVQADMVGDSMHEAVAPTLASAMLMTLVAALLFTPATLELHEYLRDWIRAAL
jgi:Na+/H+-translocating membrane pyrophosphatase